MASYALPSAPMPRLDWTIRRGVAQSRNPFTGKTYRLDHGWDRWEVRMLLVPIRTSDSTDWITWAKNLQGGVHTFPLRPPGESADSEFILSRPVQWAENASGTLVMFRPIEAVEDL